MYSFHEIRAGTLATLHEGVDCLVGDIDDLRMRTLVSQMSVRERHYALTFTKPTRRSLGRLAAISNTLISVNKGQAVHR
jgi:hypothetical protein